MKSDNEAKNMKDKDMKDKDVSKDKAKHNAKS